jgi:hypothetical protein
MEICRRMKTTDMTRLSTRRKSVPTARDREQTCRNYCKRPNTQDTSSLARKVCLPGQVVRTFKHTSRMCWGRICHARVTNGSKSTPNWRTRCGMMWTYNIKHLQFMFNFQLCFWIYKSRFNCFFLQNIWNIKDDTHKHQCLISMGNLYRNWRGHLYRQFMLKDRSPCDEWGILESNWEEFKLTKQISEFLV